MVCEEHGFRVGFSPISSETKLLMILTFAYYADLFTREACDCKQLKTDIYQKHVTS